MGNVTLGRLLSIILPGLAALVVLADFASAQSILGRIGAEFTFLPSSSTVGALIYSGAGILAGIIVDNVRVWFVARVFVYRANFYGLFRYWLSPTFLSHHIRRRPRAEAYKPFYHWHKRYSEAYNEAYLLWLHTMLERRPAALEVAKAHQLTHALYGLRQTTWPIETAVGIEQRQISITNGQIWPILAAKQKDAFRFYQEYFLSDLSANLLVVSGVGLVLALLSGGLHFLAHKAIDDDAIRLIVFGVLYVSLAQLATRHHLAQMRFFRFVLLYDAIGALGGPGT